MLSNEETEDDSEDESDKRTGGANGASWWQSGHIRFMSSVLAAVVPANRECVYDRRVPELSDETEVHPVNSEGRSAAPVLVPVAQLPRSG